LLEETTLKYAEHVGDAEEFLASRGIGMDLARSVALGVVTDPPGQHYHMRGRLSIPYLTDAGPVAIVARCIEKHNCKEVGDPDHGKMAKPNKQPNRLYGVQTAAWADDWIVVTEGEIDALTWHQMGVPAISIPGAKNWKPHYKNVFEDFSRVYLAIDGDDAGKRLWNTVKGELTHVIPMWFPAGEDSNSMFVKHGKDALLERLKK
jgi:twinkle protein